MNLKKLYNTWCKLTKRNGAILIGGSIKEFLSFLENKLSGGNPKEYYDQLMKYNKWHNPNSW